MQIQVNGVRSGSPLWGVGAAQADRATQGSRVP